MAEKRQRITSEKDLKTKEKEKELKLQFAIKWTVFYVMAGTIIVIILLTALYIYHNKEAQELLVRQMISNIGSFVMAGAFVLGINIKK